MSHRPSTLTVRDITAIIESHWLPGNPTEWSNAAAKEIHQRMSEAGEAHFNQLSPDEAERLALLVEEMGEAQQAIGKILRHGYESRHPDGGPTNREMLERELGDVESSGEMLKNHGDLNPESVAKYRWIKGYKVYQYLHHHEEFVEIT